MNVVVVMLGHKARVGKDTSADYLKKFGWERLAFADKLKTTVSDLYNFSEDQMYGELKDVQDERYVNLVDEPLIQSKHQCGLQKLFPENYETLIVAPKYLTPRRILQIFGQDQRKIYPNIWAQYVFNQIDQIINSNLNDKNTFKFIITDFRFRNEYEVAKKWLEKKETANNIKQLHLIKIERNVTVESGSSDISENDLNDFMYWDTIIHNNGSLIELYNSLDNFFLV